MEAGTVDIALGGGRRHFVPEGATVDEDTTGARAAGGRGAAAGLCRLAAGRLPLQGRDLVVTGDGERPILALAGLLPKMPGRIAGGATDIVPLTQRARRAFRAAHVGGVPGLLLFDALGPVANAGLPALLRRGRGKARSPRGHGTCLTGWAWHRATSATLSGGERQRVAIARALASDPVVVLADEPTAALHREAADHVADDLTRAAREQGRTLIAASHDGRLLARMDRVIELQARARAWA